MVRKVLVTGGRGFIGSNIVDACVERGDTVFSVDDMSYGKEANANPKVPNFKIDISRYDDFEKVFEEIKPEIVFHCAALARVQPSFERPGRYFDVNVLGTRNLLELAKKYKTRRVVYSASSSAYGDQKTMPLQEDMTIASQGLNPYGSTKRMGEMLMRDMGTVSGGPETLCLRYFNVYGPRQTTTADGPYALVIGIFFDQMRQKKPLTVVPDGHQSRDFTWVGDVVRANLLAAESKNVGNAEIINVGAGASSSVWEVARLVLGVPPDTSTDELLKKKLCVMAPPRQGEMRQTLADFSRAKKLLGWQPTMTLDRGIAELKKYYA